MSYSGTVYCSYCGKKGHNRAGCPDRKQYIKDNPNSYEAIKEKRKAEKGRKCSYCQERGHTARTCELKKQDRLRLMKALSEARTQGLKKLNELGWGVGALFQKKDGWSDSNEIYMVEEIEWSDWTRANIVSLRGISVSQTLSDDCDWKRPRFIMQTISLFENIDAYNLIVNPPLSPRLEEQKPPVGFLEGEIFDEERHFPKGMKRPYIHRRIEETGKL